MLKTGEDYLASLRDGRTIYIGDEQVKDPTSHPAFDKIAATYAKFYDLKAAPENRDLLSFEEDGERYSMYFLRPTCREDLARRTAAHRFITEFSYGLLGRSPDATAGNITGMTMRPEVFDEEGGYRENVLRLWEELKRDDAFLTYAIVPPPAARNPEYYQSKGIPTPTLRVTSEDSEGVVINGMKFLATGAAVATHVIVGNILPLAPDSGRGINHLHHSLQPGRADLVVAQADLQGRTLRVRRTAHVPLRRIRLHARVRGCEGAVGKGDRAQQRTVVAQHFHRDAKPRDVEPPVQRPVPLQASLPAWHVEPDHPSDRSARHPDGARDARAAGRHGGAFRCALRTPRSMPARISETGMCCSTGGTSMRGCTG